MANQSLAIVNNLDDGMEYPDGGQVWDASGFGSTIWNDVDTHIGLSFVLTAEVPSGATISKAYVRLRHNDGSSVDDNMVTIGVEDADPASAARWATGHLPSGATLIGETSAFEIDDLAAAFYFGESDSYPQNLASIFQSLLNKYGGLDNGGRVNIALLHDSGTNFTSFDDYSGGAGNAAQLYIEWTEGGGGTPQELAGVVEAEAVAAGALSIQHQMSAEISAESSVDAAAQVAKRIAGAASASSSVSGALVQDTRLAAAAVAESSVEGGILQSVELAGAVTAQSTVAGAAQQDTRLAGSVPAASGVSGELDSGGVALAGVVASESAAVGALQVEHPLAGAAVATSDISAWLSTGGAELQGDVAGQSAVSGAVSVHRSLLGRVDAAATPAGAVEVARELAGRIDAAGAAVGAASAAKYLAAYAASLSAVAGDLVIGQIAHEILAGVADSCRVIESWGESRREIDAEADSAGVLTDWAK